MLIYVVGVGWAGAPWYNKGNAKEPIPHCKNKKASWYNWLNHGTQAVNSLSENEKVACRERLANLSQYIAPARLPEPMRLCIFQQLQTLISQLPPDFWCHFELLAPLEQNLTLQTQKDITEKRDAREVYYYIQRRELLTSHACAAAICSLTDKLKTADE